MNEPFLLLERPLAEGKPQNESPVQSLTYSWWVTGRPPKRLDVLAMREELYTACLEEIRLKRQNGRSYDPGSDNRVKWANQWLQVGEIHRTEVDPDLCWVARHLFGPAPELCGKDYAAGEIND